MAYIKKVYENYPSTNTPIEAESLNNSENGIENIDTRLTTVETNQGTLSNLTTTEKTNLVGAINEVDGHTDTNTTNITNLQSGWNSANETWTYASVDDPTGVITISGDVTTKYSLGMRIKFTNGGNIIYGIITAISYSSPNTTLTFLHEIDPADSLAKYLMTNSAITNNYYSSMKVPYGFPTDPNKWALIIKWNTVVIQANPAAGTWYNLGTRYLDIPIGCFLLDFGTDAFADSSTAGRIDLGACLSTTNNGVSDYELLTRALMGNLTLHGANLTKGKRVTLTSKTRYYLNMAVLSGTCTDLGADGRSSTNSPPAFIRAISCYL